jgi:hypothetical protein
MIIPSQHQQDIEKKEIIVAFNCGLDYVVGQEASYRILNVSHRNYLSGKRRGFKKTLLDGYRYRNLESCSRSPELFNELYRSGNSQYLDFCYDYVEMCKDAEIIVQSGGIDILPYQILESKFPKAKKALYFVDDPHATFAYGTPYAFAYEYAIYTSDSYSPSEKMSSFLSKIGFRTDRVFKLPLCFSNVGEFLVDYKSPEDLIERSGCVYIGGYYGSKAKRLYDVFKNCKSDAFHIYGKYPLFGYAALLRLFSGEMAFTGRVKTLSIAEREQAYRRFAVGFNLHQSYEPSIECGNARTYELPSRGIAQVLDRPPAIVDSLPFEEGTEALYYDSIDDAIDKIHWLTTHPFQRAEIAFNGYLRAKSKYQWERCIADILDAIYRDGLKN